MEIDGVTISPTLSNAARREKSHFLSRDSSFDSLQRWIAPNLQGDSFFDPYGGRHHVLVEKEGPFYAAGFRPPLDAYDTKKQFLLNF